MVSLKLNSNHTFELYESSDVDIGETSYRGTYTNYGIIVLNYDSYTINADDFNISDYSNLTYIGNNIYEEKYLKKGYGIIIGNMFISFSHPVSILFR